MDVKIEAVVFGKAGCDKCKALLRRVTQLAEQPEWADVRVRYLDVETEEGLVEFCRMECLNPQRLPALVACRAEPDGRLVPIPAVPAAATDPVLGACRLYHLVGLQTDYSPRGRGVITPAMIVAVLEQARAALRPLATA
ncbi:MAG: hypothetical protein N2652_02425 [Kiritimatiellae bacterium]|nr:hypothetical protein [Kiritimatiellia bacterium]